MAKKLKFYSLWFLLINVIVFAVQNMFEWFTDMFVLNGLAISSWQIWRFVSAIFLHGSITHLAYNMFALFFFGIAGLVLGPLILAYALIVLELYRQGKLNELFSN